MKEVVTIIAATCDMCERRYEESMAGNPQVKTVEWSWDDQGYIIDLCLETCLEASEKVSRMDLIQMSRHVLAARTAKKKALPKDPAAPKKESGHWDAIRVESGPDEFGYQCPTCGDVFETGRGAAMHFYPMHGEPLLAYIRRPDFQPYAG